MANVQTMEEFLEETHKFVETNLNMIPISCDVGYGRHSAPSKKKKYFVNGEVRIPAEVFKEELRDCLTTTRKTKIVVLVFVPKDMISDKVIELLKEKPKKLEK